MPSVKPRRSPGLRREDLATLAGISVDYLVQLEQGRATNPSPAVVAALTRALRLTAADAAALYQSAGLAAPSSAIDRSLPDSVERLLARTTDRPAAAYSADWWLLRWNPAWAALMGDPMALAGRARNQVWYEMTTDTKAIWVDPAERERYRDALVGDLRAVRATHPGDAELGELVEALHAECPDFTARWDTARPAGYRGARKRISHPVAGLMRLDGDVFQATGSGVRVIVYSAAPGSPDAARLASVVESFSAL